MKTHINIDKNPKGYIFPKKISINIIGILNLFLGSHLSILLVSTILLMYLIFEVLAEVSLPYLAIG